MERLFIYLDANVLIDTIEGRDDELMGLLFRSLYNGPYCYPFSAEVIGEVTDPNRKERNDERLMYISDLSKNVYFENTLVNVGFRYEMPQKVYETISEIDTGIDINNIFADFVSFEKMVELRELFNLEPAQLNNMEPLDAIAFIDNKLENYQYEKAVGSTPPPKSLKDFVSMISEVCEKSFKDIGKPFGVNNVNFHEKDIVLFFSLLDSFGYWGDPRKKYKKGSRLVDSQHALVGSNFRAIVSRDPHFIRKSEACYEYMGIDTKAYTTIEFKEHLRGILTPGS